MSSVILCSIWMQRKKTMNEAHILREKQRHRLTSYFCWFISSLIFISHDNDICMVYNNISIIRIFVGLLTSINQSSIHSFIHSVRQRLPLFTDNSRVNIPIDPSLYRLFSKTLSIDYIGWIVFVVCWKWKNRKKTHSEISKSMIQSNVGCYHYFQSIETEFKKTNRMLALNFVFIDAIHVKAIIVLFVRWCYHSHPLSLFGNNL